MRALDVMTDEVITIDVNATVEQVANLFINSGISAAPVVDDTGKMVGIISEGDLLRRAEIGTERRRSTWLEFVSSNRDLAAEYIKAHSHRAGDLMTTDVISVEESTPIREIAELLETRHIKRVPVLRKGKPVGIVSRANLIQALATVINTRKSDTAAGDQAIRTHLLAELRNKKWSGANAANVVVQDGVVHLWGYVLSEQERRALCVAAENVPGVKSVEDHTVESMGMPIL